MGKFPRFYQLNFANKAIIHLLTTSYSCYNHGVTASQVFTSEVNAVQTKHNFRFNFRDSRNSAYTFKNHNTFAYVCI